MSNGSVSSKNADRLRVHLEEVTDPTTLDDKALFEITTSGDYYVILPHSADGRNGGSKYLSVNKNNYNQLDGHSDWKDGPEGFPNCAGILGVWNAVNNVARLFVEYVSFSLATTHSVTSKLTDCTVTGNVYGGAMGDDSHDPIVGGAINVNLNNGVADTGVKGCVVGGNIFGCNNINGTPLGSVTVHVYKTQNAGATQIKNSGEVTNAKRFGEYDVKAVYGGGNAADVTGDTFVVIGK